MERATLSLSHHGKEGISAANRARLARLLRAVSGPFSVDEATRVLELEPDSARRFLAYLAARGWLARVRRGLYVAVPLDSSEPAQWHEDPWVVAHRTFAPCYVGGWSACEHWGLTDQIFRDVVVLTARPTRDRHPVIQDTIYRLKVIMPDRLFGTRSVWRGRVKVNVSDPARTLVDLLGDPSLGGGIRHVGEVLTEWYSGEHRDDKRLLEYAERLGNRSVYKRLGFLVERLRLQAPDLLHECARRMSAGSVQLDPSGPQRGRRLRRWNLIVNVTLPAHIP